MSPQISESCAVPLPSKMPTIGQSPLPMCTTSPMFACSNRLLIELLTTTSRCPGVNHLPWVILICGRISIPSGVRNRVVTLVSPVPPLRGNTTTRMSSPETSGSPLAFLATPGRSFRTCIASRDTPPAANSESEPLRSIRTFKGSPVVAKARPRPASSAMMKTAVATVSAIPKAVMMVRLFRSRRLRTL